MQDEEEMFEGFASVDGEVSQDLPSGNEGGSRDYNNGYRDFDMKLSAGKTKDDEHFDMKDFNVEIPAIVSPLLLYAHAN